MSTEIRNRIFNLPEGSTGGGGDPWPRYWTAMVSATVENAAPTDVVLTFKSPKTLVAADFTATVNGVSRVISSASWAGNAITLVLASAVIYSDVVIVTFVKTGQAKAATNNVALTTEVTTYITGLTTALSENQKIRINTFVVGLKEGLAVNSLSDAFDAMWILAGETKESSYRNLVKDAHHVTDVVAPTWTAFEGIEGDGSTQYCTTNYDSKNAGATLTKDNASIGVYSRKELPTSDRYRVGVNDYVGDTRLSIRTRDVANNRTSLDVNGYGGSQWFLTPINIGLAVATRNATDNCNYMGQKQRVQNKNINYSNNLAAKSPFILANNLNGTAQGFCDDQLSLLFFGKYLTRAEVYVIEEEFEKYLSACGTKGFWQDNNLSVDLIRNGGFNNASVWTFVYGDWIIADGVAKVDVNDPGVIRQELKGFVEIGRKFENKFTILNAAEGAKMRIIGNGANLFEEFSVAPFWKLFQDGNYTQELTVVADTDDWFEYQNDNTPITGGYWELDNVSVKLKR